MPKQRYAAKRSGFGLNARLNPPLGAAIVPRAATPTFRSLAPGSRRHATVTHRPEARTLPGPRLT